MGGVNTKQSSIDQLYKEFSSAVAQFQPEIQIKKTSGFLMLEGPFIVSGQDGPFDAYDVRIVVPPSFPLVAPTVLETGDRIPKVTARHINPGEKTCCIGVWEEWLLTGKEISAAGFINEILHDYFVSQSHFDVNGKWPHGERSHGTQGLVEAYCHILDIDLDIDRAQAFLDVISRKDFKRHHLCPCGSGRRIKHCHQEKIHMLRSRISPDLAERMRAKLNI